MWSHSHHAVYLWDINAYHKLMNTIQNIKWTDHVLFWTPILWKAHGRRPRSTLVSWNRACFFGEFFGVYTTCDTHLSSKQTRKQCQYMCILMNVKQMGLGLNALLCHVGTHIASNMTSKSVIDTHERIPKNRKSASVLEQLVPYTTYTH